MALSGILGFAGCQTAPGTPLPPDVETSLAWPDCPCWGQNELHGEALPGTVGSTEPWKATRPNAMLGCQCLRRPRERPCGIGSRRYLGTGESLRWRHYRHQLDLQPEDRVTCRQNQILIHRTRAEGGGEEPLRNISSLRKN